MSEIARRRRVALDATRQHAEALLVTAPANVRYLTGFTGSNGQLLLADEPVFFTDGRYTEQAAEQVPDIEVSIYPGGGLYATVREAVGARGIGKLAFEAGHPEPGISLGVDAPGYMTVLELQRFTEALEGVELIGVSDVVERARVRKDATEIDAMRRAQRVAESALAGVLSDWRGGSERELALALEWAVRTGGAEGVSFEPIVATGAHAALPHARPRDVAVGDGLLLIDMGALADGYCSDMTRTYITGTAPDPLPAVHDVVVRAVEAACAQVRPGVEAKAVDAAARRIIEDAGFGDKFVHGTGHGVGLVIHEMPRLSKTSQDTLQPGMVVTIEPGVYLPGVGGVRVEDLLVVTADGAENLTSLPRGPDLPR
jgi:Xaa-Pro aminopeptidase